MTHLKLANSPLMAVLCGLTILIVLQQPVIFMAAAFKRGKELNMTKEEMKEAARSSAIFSIIPSLPIIVSYLLQPVEDRTGLFGAFQKNSAAGMGYGLDS